MSQQVPAPQGDWASQVADTIERVVGLVRDRTTQPVITITRAVVFGLLAAILGVTILVLVSILMIRVLSYLPGGVWVAYLITGVIFLAVGIIAMVLRHPPSEPA
jgi:hypothetical protein